MRKILRGHLNTFKIKINSRSLIRHTLRIRRRHTRQTTLSTKGQAEDIIRFHRTRKLHRTTNKISDRRTSITTPLNNTRNGHNYHNHLTRPTQATTRSSTRTTIIRRNISIRIQYYTRPKDPYSIVTSSGPCDTTESVPPNDENDSEVN